MYLGWETIIQRLSFIYIINYINYYLLNTFNISLANVGLWQFALNAWQLILVGQELQYFSYNKRSLSTNTTTSTKILYHKITPLDRVLFWTVFLCWRGGFLRIYVKVLTQITNVPRSVYSASFEDSENSSCILVTLLTGTKLHAIKKELFKPVNTHVKVV